MEQEWTVLYFLKNVFDLKRVYRQRVISHREGASVVGFFFVRDSKFFRRIFIYHCFYYNELKRSSFFD